MSMTEQGMQMKTVKPAPDFEAWMKEIKRIAKEELDWSKRAIESIDETAQQSWRDYFDEGLTPREAWQEEYSAAQ